jgi:hypothetical protein
MANARAIESNVIIPRLLTGHRDALVESFDALPLERSVVEVNIPVSTAPDQAAKVSVVTYPHLIRDEQGHPVLREGRKQFTEERVEVEPRLRPEFVAKDVVVFAPRAQGTLVETSRRLISRTRSGIADRLNAWQTHTIWTR